MSRGFKICLIALGIYCLLMSPLIWQGIKDGNYALSGGPVYVGLLIALLARRNRETRRRSQGPGQPTG